MMQEKQNDAAVSNIIGTIILFGFAIALLVVFQVTAVPVWNQNTEFEHSQRVQGDIGKLHDNIVLSSTTGRSTTQSVELGTQYTRRALFINPTDPSGSVSTLEPGTVALRNVRSGDGDVRDYLDGTTKEFDTRAFRYRPRYNEFANAPTVFMDNMVLYNQVRDNQARLTTQNVVSDRNINLNLLTGNISRSGVRPTSVNIDPVSAPSEVISVSNSTLGPVEIELPTNLDEDRWLSALENERVENGGHVETVSYTENEEAYNTLTLGLESGVEYNLRMSKIGVGEIDERQQAHYIVNKGYDIMNVATDSSERIDVEVRDRYNNPVSGVDVNTDLQGDGNLETIRSVTDAEGVASFRYQAPSTAGTAGLNLSIGTEARERVNVAIDTTSGGGGGGTGEFNLDQGRDSGVRLTGVSSLRSPQSSVAQITFQNDGAPRDILEAQFIFFYDNSPGGDTPRNLRLNNGGTNIPVRGEATTLGTPITLTSGTNSVDFRFRPSNVGSPAPVSEQDFALFRLEFSDGSRSTYMVQLNPTS